MRYTGRMRILHTSDWHLGRTLHGRSRAAEHEAFLDELVDLAGEVDLVLVSGDVFESTNPPIDAEQLYFDALARLGDGGRRGVVVIAGNHDSPDRLRASAPLCERHGVWVLGRPGDRPSGREGPAPASEGSGWWARVPPR
ncbi:MAG: exonuclease subunit SbcD [Myxococcota bacterium]